MCAVDARVRISMSINQIVDHLLSDGVAAVVESAASCQSGACSDAVLAFAEQHTWEQYTLRSSIHHMLVEAIQ